ncbi:MAG: metal-dependent hydrolase [Euryarchaeota archaeon]|nr:metal-dependent hydrolase [Euryarchaeota archaeon]MBU4608387.1 metal-dependent hydrolase [Euryarchaeota archaeon]MBV1728790.1 metal-dependent hydrolase [Methanobacterium sp.]MBV1755451.1 metal-dependent hydrolase [Methanobacterium sp.]MBV1768548.1 metal-dependent hydrolase [Methanobacterium sp.]
MSSYKKHAIFALIFILPFYFNIFSLALAVIGASLPDFDHELKKKNISILFLTGFLLTVITYLLGLPYTIGIILMDMALIFYLSRHRGFTHSLIGIIILSLFLTILVISTYFFLSTWGLDKEAIFAIIVLFLGVLAVNKRIIIPFLFISLLGIFLIPLPAYNFLNLYNVFGPIFLGFLSHSILDMFNPSGVELLRPFVTTKFKKPLGFFSIAIWLVLSFYSLSYLF